MPSAVGGIVWCNNRHFALRYDQRCSDWHMCTTKRGNSRISGMACAWIYAGGLRNARRWLAAALMWLHIVWHSPLIVKFVFINCDIYILYVYLYLLCVKWTWKINILFYSILFYSGRAHGLSIFVTWDRVTHAALWHFVVYTRDWPITD